MKRGSSRVVRQSVAPGVLFLLFWTAIVGVFDVIVVGGLAWQTLSWRYATTTGTIQESRTELGRDDDGDQTFTVVVKYRYEVGGTAYDGNRIRYFDMSFNHEGKRAEKTRRRYAVGKEVPVYYDPDNPQHAILDRSLRGEDFFLLLFLNPFNVVMIGGWTMLVQGRRKESRPAGLRVRDDGVRVVLQFYSITPLSAAAATVLVTSFVLIFVCLFGMSIVPFDWLVAGAWTIVAVSAAAVWWNFRTPTSTMEYDRFSGRISIATHDGQSHSFNSSDIVTLGDEREEGEPVSTADPPEVDVADADVSLGNEEEGERERGPAIIYRDAQGKEKLVRLAAWSTPNAERWLARWLRDTMRLKV